MLFGAAKAEAVLVGVNWRLAPPEIEYIIQDAGCDIVFVGAEFYDVIEALLTRIPSTSAVIALGRGHPHWPASAGWRDAQSTVDPLRPLRPDDDVLQLYTSGTTGHPKGAQLTNANYCALWRASEDTRWGLFDAELVTVTCMPVFHVAGANMGIFALAQGSTNLVLKDVDPLKIPQVIPQYHVSYALFVPALILIVDGQGQALPVGEVGEIVLRHGIVMKGYWKRPDASADAIRDGWFQTGDAGYLDAEGYLYIHDRMKDMVVSGGENVYPAEVENALFGHPVIADVAVIGVPDERWGEAVKAVVVLKPGCSVTVEELVAFARERIAAFKVPKSADFVSALPRNPSGKILRRELRDPYWQGHSRRVN